MKVETASKFVVRCDHPGCMAGYLGWNEKCPDCEGGWIEIPEASHAGTFRAAAGYLTFVVGMALFMYFISAKRRA